MAQLNFEQSWRKRFERFAKYDQEAQIAGWSEHSLQTRVAIFEKHWQERATNQQWLDLGCGAGTYSKLLSKADQDVLALDYSYPTLIKAKQNCQPKYGFATADARFLPIKPKSFDGILCLGVLQALEKPLEAVDEIAKALKPQGEIWIDVLNRNSLRFTYEWLKYKVKGEAYRLNYVSPWVLKKHMHALGFKQIELIWMPILPKRFKAVQNTLQTLTEQYPKLSRIWGLLSHAVLIKASY